MEEWRPVVGYEGWYSVSDKGNIRRDVGGSNVTFIGKILKPASDGQGYLMVTLSKEGKHKVRTVHRMVAAAFLGARPLKLVINHKDGVKANNNLGNLEYVTSQQNVQHAYANRLQIGRAGEKHHGAKLTDKDVIAIREEYEVKGTSQVKLGEKYGVCFQSISLIVLRKTWRHI